MQPDMGGPARQQLRAESYRLLWLDTDKDKLTFAEWAGV
jgi:hypothetical protein